MECRAPEQRGRRLTTPGARARAGSWAQRAPQDAPPSVLEEMLTTQPAGCERTRPPPVLHTGLSVQAHCGESHRLRAQSGWSHQHGHCQVPTGGDAPPPAEGDHAHNGWVQVTRRLEPPNRGLTAGGVSPASRHGGMGRAARRR